MPCASAGSRSPRPERSPADAIGSSVLARRLSRCRTKAYGARSLAKRLSRCRARAYGALVLAWRLRRPLTSSARSRRKSILRQYGSAMARGGATRLPCGHVDRRVSTGDLHPRRPVPSGGPSGLLLRCGEPRSSRRGSPFLWADALPPRARVHPGEPAETKNEEGNAPTPHP
jgi:hypothetical protein